MIAKDPVKEALFDALGTGDSAWSNKLGIATYALLFLAVEQEVVARRSCVLEANFDHNEASAQLAAIQLRQPFRALQIVCTASREELLDRFVSRAGSRHPGHIDDQRLADVEESIDAGRWQALELDGETIEVDTTNWATVDLDALVARARTEKCEACSREGDADLFGACRAAGTGCSARSTQLRSPRCRGESSSASSSCATLPGCVDAFAERIADGFLYGDFQFAIDPADRRLPAPRVFSCYRPVDNDDPDSARAACAHDSTTGQSLLYLTHTDKSQAFERYADHYLATSGQLYWSDAHQSAEYYRRLPPCARQGARLGRPCNRDDQRALRASRYRLDDFMEDVVRGLQRARASTSSTEPCG